jgi:cobalt-zinc-cadmium efflux system outer membrane protein
VRKRRSITIFHCLMGLIALVLISAAQGRAGESDAALELRPLIDEALKNNRELLTADSSWKASTYRINQATSLPDPMVSIGYQNEGWNKYTYGTMQGSQWMYSVAQTFPFPGKRSLKGEMAEKDAESGEASYRAARLKTIATVKELYYELFLAYKNLDLISDKTALFSRIEYAAVARYSSGMASQQEVLMAQAEKYMLLEKETMLKQKVQSLEAMLNNAVGRDINSPLGRPAEPAQSTFPYSMEELQKTANENSPEIRSREKMVSSSVARLDMARREYFPDFTIAASVFQRTGDFQDMWSLTATFNIPLFYKTKQEQGVAEAKSFSFETRYELEGTKLMISSAIRDNYTMFKTAEKLMDLYKQGLIPKTYQDFESAIAGYATGKVEAITVISRLKALLDVESLYWGQVVEREKAVARMESIAGISDAGTAVKSE